MKADDLNWEKCAPFCGPWHHQMSSIYRKSIVIYDVIDYVIEIGAPKQNMFWKRLTKTKISLQLVQKQNSYDQKSCRKAWSCKKKWSSVFTFYVCMSVCLSVRKLQVTVVDLGTSSSTWGTLITRVRKVYFCFWKFSFLRILGQSLYIVKFL